MRRLVVLTGVLVAAFAATAFARPQFHQSVKSPSPVTGLRITNVGDSQVTVAFNLNSGREHVTRYDAQVLSGPTASSSSSPVTIGGLVNGTTYSGVQVRAVNASGAGPWTVLNQAFTPQGTQPPPPPPPSGTYPVPSSLSTACPVTSAAPDATAGLRSFLATVPDGATVTFDPARCYRIEGTVQLQDRSGLTFDGGGQALDSGATLAALNAPQDQVAMWRFYGGTGIHFQGMVLQGAYCCGGTLDESIQHSHAIDLRGVGAEIGPNVTINDWAGDGVYFGLDDRYSSTNGVQSTGSVHDSKIQYVGRNAVSVVAGHDVQIVRNRLHLVGFTHVDVEPNSVGPGVQRVTVDSNTISGSWRLAVFSVVPTGRPISDVAFTNNTLSTPLKVVVNPNQTTSSPPQNTTISGNQTSATSSAPVIDVHYANGGTVSNNTVPMSGGTFAAIDHSCGYSVFGNSFPGGSTEAVFTSPSC